MLSLRGLLKSNYKFGITSVIRENILGWAVSTQVDADNAFDKARAELSLLPLKQGQAVYESLDRAFQLCAIGQASRRLLPPASMNEILRASDKIKQIKEVIGFLKILKQTDYCAKLDAIFQNM